MFSQVMLVEALQCRPALEKGPAASSGNSTSRWVTSLTPIARCQYIGLWHRQRLVSASPREVHVPLPARP